jgi:hypothetical protein
LKPAHGSRRGGADDNRWLIGFIVAALLVGGIVVVIVSLMR